MRFLLLLTACLLLTVLRLHADDAKPDPIDLQVKAMMDKDPSTYGMMDAIKKGTELWDAQMNQVYAKLLKKLPEAERASLQKSQRAWLAYRDANSDLVATVYGHAEGTMYRPMAANELLELVKARTLLLRGYLDLLEENSP